MPVESRFDLTIRRDLHSRRSTRHRHGFIEHPLKIRGGANALLPVEGAGFRWGQSFTEVKPSVGDLRLGSLSFAVTTPKNYTYYVMPRLVAAVKGSAELASFQLMFHAVSDPCR